MLYNGFIGSLGTVRSVNQNCEHTINFYTEQASGNPKVPTRLQYTPRIEPFVVLQDGPIRALFAQDGRCFAVSGNSFYEIFANRTAILRGTAAADGDPATIMSNGTGGFQLGVTSGSLFYVYDLNTNVISEVTTGIEPVQTCAFTDGYGLVLQKDSNTFAFSALEDFATWDPLDVNQISTVSDQVVTMLVSHREIFLLGSQSSSVWANVGDADNPFQPIPGVQIAQGSGAAFGAVNLDNTVYFLGGNEIGNRIVYRFKGYTPERISNHAVEYILNNYPRVENAIAWSYSEEGHAFYVLYLPSPPDPTQPIRHTFLVYDVSTGEWHERALWDPTLERWKPHIGRCHCVAFSQQIHLVGDRRGPAIYLQTLKPSAGWRVEDEIVVVN